MRVGWVQPLYLMRLASLYWGTVSGNTGEQAKMPKTLGLVVTPERAESIGHADAIANDDRGLLSDPFSKQLYHFVKAGK